MNQTAASDGLVIGYGNEWRGDDGAGPAVSAGIASLELTGVIARSVHQLTPDLAETISQAARVVFVDAACEAGTGIAIRRIQADGSAGVMTHVVDPRALLAMSNLLYGKAPPAWLVTIEGRGFSPGEELSEFTSRLVAEAIERIVALLETEQLIETIQ